MRPSEAKNGAKRMRNHRMVFEYGNENASNALTQNLDHSLIVLIYETK